MACSKKVVQIIYRLGHCCSYNVVEGQETVATLFASFKKTVCPAGVKMWPNLFISAVFDNFDRYVDTGVGENTLYDTVGILVQKKYCRRTDDDSDSSDVSSDDEDDPTETTYSRPKKWEEKPAA